MAAAMERYLLKNLKLSQHEAESFAPKLLRYLPAEIVRYGQVPGSVVEALRGLDELASPEVFAERARKFSVADPELLRERVLPSAPGKITVAGLRFRKLNPEFPFVELTLNYLPAAAEIRQLRSQLLKAYSPLRLWGFTITDGPGEFSGEEHECWSHVLFGHTAPAELTPLPAQYRTSGAGVRETYPAYLREYEELLAGDPAINKYLRFETEEDLQEAEDKGLLLNIYDEQGWSGVIAGQAKELHGLPVLYIFELFLVHRLRGNRIAKPLQAAFRAQQANQFPFVYGAISGANTASLRTALSLGRKIVETEYFFPLI